MSVQRVSEERILTIEELASFLKLSQRTLYRMLDREELPFAIKLKGAWRFKESDVLCWLDSQKLVHAQKR